MPVALFLSPHLDDVAFSCAGTLVRLIAAEWRVSLVTVFTATVISPQGFALRCQTDKGISPETDYMALRRAEDCAFARIAGIEDVRQWSFAEAPHRGYESAPELFGGMHADDEVWEAVAEHLWDAFAEIKPNFVFAPQGLGNHVDHLQVIRALDSLATDEEQVAGRVWYRDTPYAIRQPDAEPSMLLPAGLNEAAVSLAPDVLDRKIDGACAYESQIGFQFSGAGEVRRKLIEFHADEAERAGLTGFAERFLAAAEVGAMLMEALA